MPQYFDNDSTIVSKKRTVILDIDGIKIPFVTDNGVFSKGRVDDGTKALLKVLLPLNLNGRILDVGCGYGALGLTLAYSNPSSEFTLIDVNVRALNLAKDNKKNLHLDNVTILQSDIYENVKDKFNFIVTNPPIRAGKKVIYQMFSGGYNYLFNGGSLFIVIRKDQGANSACAYIKEIYGNCTLLKRDKGYYIYQAIKNESSLLREEPFHETKK